MTTVTGFTAARMLAMEAATIVDGDIVGDNLILTRHDGATINAGNVRGPTGSPGVTLSELNAALLQLLPIGVILDYIETTPPTNYLAMTGQTVVNAQSLYPDWWAKLPASMKSGSNAIMPDTRGKVSVGYNSTDTDFDAIGETGGAKTVTLTQAQLPNATVTIDPPSTTINVDPPNTYVTAIGSNIKTTAYSAQSGPDPVNIITGLGGFQLEVDIPNFTTSVDIAPFQSGALGSGQAHSNVQPYVVFLKIIKVA